MPLINRSNYMSIPSPKSGIDDNTILMIHSDTLTDNSKYQHMLVTQSGTYVDTIGKFNSKSIKFTNSSLTVTSHPTLALHSYDFTIDFWIKFNVLTNNVIICGSANNEWGVETYGTTIKKLLIRIMDNTIIEGDLELTTNQWYHIAVVRQNTKLLSYINGHLDINVVINSNISWNQPTLIIGKSNFNGWIDEFRICSGIARWINPKFNPNTWSYTNTSAFGDDPYTVLSIHNEVNTIDEIVPSIISEMDLTQVSGEFSQGIEFDNPTEAATYPIDTLFDFNDEDWTFDCWIKLTQLNRINILFCNNSDMNGVLLQHNSITNSFQLLLGNNHEWSILEFPYTMVPDVWTHIAIVNHLARYTMFVNGNYIGKQLSIQIPTTITADSKCVIGSNFLKTNSLQGYIDDIRISRGSALYNENFVVPNFEYYTNIVFKSTFEYPSQIDMKHHMVDLNGMVISSDQHKSGTNSLKFDNINHITISGNDLGIDGDATIEYWMFIPGVVTDTIPIEYKHWTDPIIPLIISIDQFNLDTWHHIAITRYNSTITLWVNGSEQGSAVSNVPLIPSGQLYLGWSSSSTGYIDDVIITKDLAKYTSPFTP